MTVRERFPVGSRIRVLAKGRHAARLGIVVGYGDAPDTVRAHLDGHKWSSIFRYRVHEIERTRESFQMTVHTRHFAARHA